MQRLTRWLLSLSPWIALGLAGALVMVVLERPTPRSSETTATTTPSTIPLPPQPTSEPQPPALPVERPVASYADAVARGAPAVVNISTRRVVIERQVPEQFAPFFPDWPEFRRREESSRGSGVIIDNAGHIATNFHVIKGMEDIVVQLTDGRSSAASLVGTDPDTDLALLKISLKPLPVMPLGRSDTLRVGDIVLAIGNSAGLGQTVTQGIVSATGRSQLGLALLENFIQTDAAINPGNSGGALINANGELVGINTAILNRQQGIEGIGFAIPVNLVRGVMQELEAKGQVLRGWTGIGVRGLPAELHDERGAAIHGVQVIGLYPNSPVKGTDVRPGDIITSLDGTPVSSVQDFLGGIARKAPGSTVKLGILRPRAGRLELTLPVIAQPRER